MVTTLHLLAWAGAVAAVSVGTALVLGLLFGSA